MEFNAGGLRYDDVGRGNLGSAPGTTGINTGHSSKAKKRKYVNSIPLEETAIKMLTREEDQIQGLEIVNFVYVKYPSVGHSLETKEYGNYYTISFKNIKKLDVNYVSQFVSSHCDRLRDVRIVFTDIEECENNDPYMALCVDVYYFHTHPSEMSIPMFTDVGSNSTILTKDMILSALESTTTSKDKEKVNTILTISKSIVDAVHNKEEFPAPMSLSLVCEEAKDHSILFGVKFQGIESISYSFLEWLFDLISPVRMSVIFSSESLKERFMLVQFSTDADSKWEDVHISGVIAKRSPHNRISNTTTVAKRLRTSGDLDLGSPKSNNQILFNIYADGKL